MRNLKMIIEYDGHGFYGWQKQPEKLGLRTVQQALEQAITKITSEHNLQIIAAGRTDTGVHAKGQVVNVKINKEIEPDRLRHALNSIMDNDIKIRAIEETAPEFHARFDAKSRVYRYFISQMPSAFSWRHKTFISQHLGIAAMQACANLIIGEYDFSGFAKHNPDQPSKKCRVLKAEWRMLNEEELMFEIQANRFLHSMVRLLVGTMLDVGKGKRTPEDFQKVLNSHNVQNASSAAAPQGLFLWEIHY